MSGAEPDLDVLTCSNLSPDAIVRLARRYGVSVAWLAPGSPIAGSFWGEPEAGIAGMRLFLRSDTPVHSLLHELSHIVCMTQERRDALDADAGSDDVEEAAVCYLQVILADYLPGVGRRRLMRDMDTWGYSFRHGTTERWFLEDASDTRDWLVREGLLLPAGEPAFRLRSL